MQTNDYSSPQWAVTELCTIAMEIWCQGMVYKTIFAGEIIYNDIEGK